MPTPPTAPDRANEPRPYWNIDRIMHLIIGLALGALIIWLLRYLRDALLPFFVACLIAYLLQPVVEFNRRWTHEKGRTISSILTLLEVVGVISGLFYLLMPIIIKEFDMLDKIVQEVMSGQRPIPESMVGVMDFIEANFNPATVRETLMNMRMESLISRGSSLLSESLEVLGQLLDWALAVVYVLFILIDYPQIVHGFKLIIPFKYRTGAMSVVHEVQVSMDHYFRGQGFVALCAAVFYCIGFSIVGLPLAIPMGILVGILYMIPYFQYITVLPVALICFLYSLGGAETFTALLGKSILVYVIVQPVCDYIITPRIMGKELGLNAAVILLSLSVWGSLLGIIGMIIALPVTSLLMSYYEQYISNPHKRHQPKTSDNEQ